VRLHDKHAALVSIGKHLGFRGEHAHYGISDKEMTAEEWKRLLGRNRGRRKRSSTAR
jgi:hypothetical protein